jgi:hypothetical protein
MLRRTAFKLKQPERVRQRDREYIPSTVKPVTPGSYGACGERAEPMPKDAPVRSEAYRRLVAAMPCKYCGRVGRSQAAHPPPDGKAIKHDDRLCFALCADELGRKGCHPRFDQYELFPHDEALRMAAHWGEETRVEIIAAGDWPLGLERL